MKHRFAVLLQKHTALTVPTIQKKGDVEKSTVVRHDRKALIVQDTATVGWAELPALLQPLLTYVRIVVQSFPIPDTDEIFRFR
jgi:hypothetical protein